MTKDIETPPPRHHHHPGRPPVTTDDGRTPPYDRHADASDTVDADTVVRAGATTANTELAATAGPARDGAGRIRVDAACPRACTPPSPSSRRPGTKSPSP
ncbi:hypothetical protein ACWDZ4_34915 [Streptomyces sp. NPDC003016]